MIMLKQASSAKKYRNKLGISQDVLSKKQIWRFV